MPVKTKILDEDNQQKKRKKTSECYEIKLGKYICNKCGIERVYIEFFKLVHIEYKWIKVFIYSVQYVR